MKGGERLKEGWEREREKGGERKKEGLPQYHIHSHKRHFIRHAPLVILLTHY